jgi:HK97 family phage major capsid protein
MPISQEEKRALLARVGDLRGKSDTLAKAGRTKEAHAVLNEIDGILDKLEFDKTEHRLEAFDKWRNQPAAGPVPNALPTERNNDSDYDDPVVHSREYREAFGRYLQSAGQRVDRLLHEVQERYAALTVGSDVGGGFTLPAHLQEGILARRAAASPILGLFSKLDSQGKMDVEWPRVQPNATSGSIFTSGFVGSMVGEGSTAGQNEPTFGMLSGSLKRGKSWAKFSIDLDLDTIEEFLIRDGSQNMALLQEQQSIIGSGIGNNCKGILNYSGDGTGDTIATVDVEGSTSNEISNTTGSAGSAPKILDLIYAVPAQYRRSANFRIVMTSLQEKKIRQLVDGQGRFHWSGDGGFGAPADGLLGYKTEVSEFPSSWKMEARTAIACYSLAT